MIIYRVELYLHKENNWYLVGKDQVSVTPPGTPASMIIHACPKGNGACSYWFDKNAIAKNAEGGWCSYCGSGPSDEIRGLWLLHNFDEPELKRAEPAITWGNDPHQGIYKV